MTVYQQISRNKWKTAFLMALFIAILLALGYFGGIVIGGDTSYGITWLFYASILSIIMTLASYFWGDSIALMTSGAKEIKKEDSPYLWNIVENLCIAMGLPMPRVYIIPDNALNAFATGRDPQHASIAFTTGIVNALENEELEAVAAHELSHVQNYDSRVMMIVAVLVGSIAILANTLTHLSFFRDRDSREGGGQVQMVFMVIGIVLIILSPIISQLIQLAVSRKREFLADAGAVLHTRYADGLIGALQKIAAQGQQGRMQTANKGTAHLYFASPFGSGKAVANLFSTHPPVEKRIEALKAMGGINE